MYVHTMCQSMFRGPAGALLSLELELQTVLSLPVIVLRTEFLEEQQAHLTAKPCLYPVLAKLNCQLTRLRPT